MRGTSRGTRPLPQPSATRRESGELESEVLAALWSRPEPLTAAEVREVLGDELAYTTVFTILSRLLAKDAVSREKTGRSYVYRPTVDPDVQTAERMRRLMHRGADRSSVLAHFVGGLSRAETRALRRLMDKG